MELARKNSFLLVFVLCIGCSSIHIESASSPEQRADSGSDIQASQMQSNWLARFRSLPSSEKGLFLKRLVDSVNINMIRNGWRISDQWQYAQEQKGHEINGAEIRELLRLSDPDNDPYIRAYAAMAHEAATLILEHSQSGSELMRFLPIFIGNMGENATAVYGLAESLLEYETILNDLEKVNDELNRQIEPELRMFR